MSEHTAECKVCGLSVTRIEAPLHIEDHVQRGDLFRIGIDWNYDPTARALPSAETRAESDPRATNGRVSTAQSADGDSA